MKESFNPDFIIGSNVSSNAQKPEEDDLFSQLENMLSVPTNYEINADEGLLINISMEIGTLDLSEIDESIDIGYHATIANMDSIKARLKKRYSEKEFDDRRRKFNEKKKPLQFESVNISGLDKQQAKYIKASFGQLKDLDDLENVKRLYYKTYADEKIKFIYPTARYDTLTKKFTLNLDILKQKSMEVQIGGVLSTSPINTGYASFKYNFFSKVAISAGINGYFGNVYQSAKINVIIDVPSKIPFYWEPYFAINNYDFFKSSSSVFDEVQPPFIITNEVYLGNSIGFPFILNSIFSIDYKYFVEDYTYYTNSEFNIKDTSDNTNFRANTIGLTIDRFNYDYKQYASSGNRFYLDTRLVTGYENTSYVSPDGTRISNSNRRTWLQIHLEYSGFPIVTKYYYGITI